MVQILPAAKSFGGEFAKALGGGAGKGFSESLRDVSDDKRENRKLDEAEKRQFRVLQEQARLKQESDLAKIKAKQDMVNSLVGGEPNKRNTGDMLRGQNDEEESTLHPGFDPSKFSDEDILRATAADQGLGNALAKAKDVALRENTAQAKAKERKFESERTYHTQFSKAAEEKANNLRTTLPKQEMAIDFARNAIESGQVGAFTMNHLADIIGADSLRNAKGAQLILASKEQLIPNLGRISAKAQNIFMEKRISSMIPQVGLKDEANKTMQEMIEGEAAIDRAYLSEMDRLTDQDMNEYGFVKKDVDKRARNAVNSKEKEIVKRTTYRLKEIEEDSKGLSSLKKEVGKNVVKGTPLTLSMAKLYKDKFKEDALKVAEKNGYYIPTLEEFKVFQQRPQEFREEL